MDRERLLALRAAIDAVIASPDELRAEVARWLAPEPSKQNGHDPHPPPHRNGNESGSIPEPHPPPRSTPYAGKTHHGRPTTSTNTAERKLLAAIADNPGLSVVALANAGGSSRSATGERLRQMALRGVVEKDLTGRWKLKGEKPRPPDPPQPPPS